MSSNFSLQENTQNYILLQQMKKECIQNGKEFQMDDGVRYLLYRKFRKEYDEKHAGEEAGNTSQTSPTKSDDSGLGSEDELYIPESRVVKNLVKAM